MFKKLLVALSIFLCCCSSHPPALAAPVIEQATKLEVPVVPVPKTCAVFGDKKCIPMYQIVGEINTATALGLQKYFDLWREEPVEGFLIRIDSPGGDTMAAFRIHDAIKNAERRAPVTCIADGSASSAAFFVMQTCTFRVGTNMSKFMTHNPYVVISGTMPMTYIDAMELAEMLKAFGDMFAKVIADKMGIKPAEYLKHVAGKDWALNAETALAEHAIDDTAITFGIYLEQLRAR